MQDPGRHTPSTVWSASFGLMIGLAACFAMQELVVVHLEKPYHVYLALSDYGMKSWHLWELFTYQFFHSFESTASGLIHLLLNLLGLWFIGRAVEARLGIKRFLLVYLGSSFAGAVLQGAIALAGYYLPDSAGAAGSFVRDRFGGPVAGSSAGLCGVLAAFCLMNDGMRIRLFYVVPIKGGQLLAVAFGLAGLLVIIPSDPSVAHLAHLGGLLTGMVLFKAGMGRDRGSGARTAVSARTQISF